MHRSIALEIDCPACGARATRTYSAHARADRLHVAASVHCSACTLASEEDHDGLPDEFRRELLAREGTWRLVIVEIGPSPLVVVRLIRFLTDATLAEAMGRVRERTPICVGTIVEIEQLRMMFEKLGAVVMVATFRETDPRSSGSPSSSRGT